VSARLDEIEDRLLSRVVMVKGPLSTPCWEWTGGRSGLRYGGIRFNGPKVKTHRLAYELWVDEIPDGLYVLHHCDNPLCINPEHLYAGTQQKNMADMIARGRCPDRRGERCGLAAITKEQALLIKCLLAAGYGKTRIAHQFGITPTSVYHIRVGRTWSHVVLPENWREYLAAHNPFPVVELRRRRLDQEPT
jgi:hypothetical protein